MLALAAVTVCGPWPGWEPSPIALIAVCGAFLALARPRGNGWWPWTAVAIACVVGCWPAAKAPQMDRLAMQLEKHCRSMLAKGVELGGEADLLRLLGAFGEVVDPALPFGTLDRAARGAPGRTVFLADHRGQVVAWGGAKNSFPHSVRPLGQRRWGISWSVGSADLWLREPVLVEGRLVGAIIVSDRRPLEGDLLWGMRGTSRHTITIGIHRPGAVVLQPDNGPGIEVPVAVSARGSGLGSVALWLGWLVLAAAALIFESRLAWLVVVIGGASMLAATESPPSVAAALTMLLAGASLGRLARTLPPVGSRTLVLVALAGAAVFAVFGAPADRLHWLPEHLLR